MLLLAFIPTVSLPTETAEAAETDIDIGITGKWINEGNGNWRYKNKYTQKLYTSGVYKINGKYYVLDNFGYMLSDGYWNNIYYGKNGARQYSLLDIGQIGKWKHNKNGWWYETNNGWYPRNRVMRINGVYYKFGKGGYAYWYDKNVAKSVGKVGTKLTPQNAKLMTCTLYGTDRDKLVSNGKIALFIQ